MIPMHFTYVYGMRMRPNAYPKQKYEGVLLMDGDAAFLALEIQLSLDGLPEECASIRDRYSLKCGNLGDGPMKFEAGETVPLSLMRGDPRPQKLRKRRDGGRGIDIEVWIRGLKQYPGASAHFSADTGATGEPKP